MQSSWNANESKCTCGFEIRSVLQTPTTQDFLLETFYTVLTATQELFVSKHPDQTERSVGKREKK